jgi:hypothetical protein
MLLALLAGAVPLAVYAATLHPGLPAGDSGELIAVAHGLGIAHPPGYPLYTWLGHLFLGTWPTGSAAWRLNLLSALLTAAAAGVLAPALVRWTGSRAAGLLGAWVLAFHPVVWKYALVAEVFALNTLLACAVFACVVRIASDTWRESAGTAAPLAALAALGLLTVSHHHSLLLLVLPGWCVAAVACAGPAPLRRAFGLPRAPYAPTPRAVARGIALGLLALLPLLHLPWAARRGALPRWGECEELGGLVHHLLRRDYGTFSLAPEHLGLVSDASHGALYLEALVAGSGLPIVLLALGGAAWTLAVAPRRAPALALVGLAIGQLWFFTRIGYPGAPPIYLGVVERFYALPQVGVAAFAAAGAALVLARVPVAWRAALRVALPTATAVGLVSWHLGAVDQRGNTAAEDLVRTLLASVPEGGVLFSRGDLFANGSSYLQRVEGLRPDAVVVDQGLLQHAWYRRQRRGDPPVDFGDAETPRDRVERLEGRRPACFVGVRDPDLGPGIALVPRGLVACARPGAAAADLTTRLSADLAIWEQIRWQSWFRPQDPRSFESAERRWLAALAARTAIDLCQPEAGAVRGPGLEALDAFLVRHRLEAEPWPELLWADALLRIYQPTLRDPAAAAALLRRQLAIERDAGRAADARRRLDQLARRPP